MAPPSFILKISRATSTSWSTTLFTETSIAKPDVCLGTIYEIKAGDTCQSISTALKISTSDLLRANALQARCNGFPTSGKLCIPTDSLCNTHKVSASDTCQSITQSFSMTWAQLVSWNPILGRSCEGLSSLTNFVICISNPGGNYVNPEPTSVITTAASTTQYVFRTFHNDLVILMLNSAESQRKLLLSEVSPASQ
jgi:LysM repeat protein